MSGFLLEQPLVIQGTKEEAGGTFGNALPLKFLPSAKNYATDEKMIQQFINEIAPTMVWTRQDRHTIEMDWMNIRDMNAMKHDAGRRYFGRSDTYMPLYKRERNKMISTLSKGLFPTDEYFDVVDRTTGDPAKAKPVKVYMQWELESNAKIKTFIKPHLGSLCDYGTAPMKFWYKKTIRSEGNVTRKGGLASLMYNEYGFRNVCKEGLAVSPRNLFYWYVYPSTCESLDDAVMIFEDIDIPISFVEWMKNSGRWVNVDDEIESLGAEQIPEHEMARQDLLQQRGGGMNIPGRGLMSKMAAQVTVTECWTYMVLPRDAYLAHEDHRLPLPVVITALGTHKVVSIRRNPFFHQRPPYAVSRTDWEAGLFYGNAQGKIIRPLQLLTNDFMNQTNDNGILGMNPVAIIDVNKMAGTPTSYFPGAAWYTLGPDAVKFDRPPIDQVQMGMQMTNMIMGLAQDMGGSPPDYGSKTRAGNTATGMQIAQRNVQGPIADSVEDIENDTMLPIIEGGFKNAVQYRNEAVMASVVGEPITVTPDMLAIDAQFRCLASSQAQNAQVRNQQAMQLIQLITPIVPIIMQQGYIVDFVAIIKRVWVDGFGYRGFEQFIRKNAPEFTQPSQATQGMPTRPDQMGGVQAQQQDNLRSALEQVQGHFGAEEMQPGEGQDFTDIRNQADQLAGLAGGYNNNGGIG